MTKLKNHHPSSLRTIHFPHTWIRLFCLAICLCSYFPSQAATKIWAGAFGSSWLIPQNWVPFGVPSSNDDVVISNTPFDPQISSAVSAKSVAVNAGANLTVAVGGTLTIAGSSGDGLENLGNVLNQGTIQINNTSTSGIDNQATFTNQGSIIIGSNINVGNDGIRNSGVFANNSGTIRVNRCNFRGIYNLTGGTFTNAASILIGNNLNPGSNGIRNAATFLNDTGGDIRINRTAVRGIYNSAGTFTNVATIVIGGNQPVGDHGIRNTAVFNNNNGGTIHVSRTTFAGIYNESGTFTNRNNLNLGPAASVGNNGIRNDATFNNNAGGSIQVNRSTLRGIYNAAGTFTNVAAITIGANHPAGEYGIRNAATFHNNNGGTIQIDQTSIAGIYHETGTFNNRKTIQIGATASVGENGIRNDATFHNHSGGSIQINQSTIRGIYNAGGTFTNVASITIGATTNVGDHGIVNQANFNNTAGTIQIDRSTTAAIDNALGTFVNTAAITIGSTSLLGQGVANSATFQNNTGGILTINNSSTQAISNESNTFTNAATISIGSSGITGVGILNEASFNHNAGVVNIDNTSWIALLNHPGATFTNAVTLNIGKNGGTYNISGDGIRNMGTFNNNNGATLNIDETSSEGIVNDGGLITNHSGATINIDNTLQEGFENLPTGTITNNSIINIGQNGGPTNITREGILNKGVFNHNTGAVLNIDNTGTHGLGCRSAATFTNAATINIGQNGGTGNIGGMGLANNGVFDNNSGGVIDIDNIVWHGLYNAGGPFNNNSGGLIQIDNVGDGALRNLGGSTFTNASMIELGQNGGNITGGGVWNINTFHNSGGTILIDNVGGFGMNTVNDFQNYSGGFIDIDNTGAGGINFRYTITNHVGGIIDIDNTGGNGVQGTNGAFFYNYGELNIGTNGVTGNISEDGVKITDGNINGGDSFHNHGTLSITNTSGHSVHVIGPQAFFHNNGILKGTGSFHLDGEELDGTVSPGLSLGSMNYTENQTFTAIDTMEIQVDGTTPNTQHDLITVADTAFISGTLSITVNYSPLINDRIVFLTASHISGSFTNFSPALPTDWYIDYSVPGEVAMVYTVLLPTELLSFDAIQTGSEAQLSWETASELNNEGFMVEHSVDGNLWTQLDFVPGLASNSEGHRYAYTHAHPREGLNYYRLKQVDFDGAFTYSDIRILDIALEGERVSVFPNPSSGLIHFSEPLSGNFLLRNMHGQVVWQIDGEEILSLDFSSIPGGTYFLQHRNPGKKGKIEKIVLLNN